MENNGFFQSQDLILPMCKGSAFLSSVIYIRHSFEFIRLYDDINLVDLHIEGHDTSSYKVTACISEELLHNIQIEI